MSCAPARLEGHGHGRGYARVLRVSLMLSEHGSLLWSSQYSAHVLDTRRHDSSSSASRCDKMRRLSSGGSSCCQQELVKREGKLTPTISFCIIWFSCAWIATTSTLLAATEWRTHQAVAETTVTTQRHLLSAANARMSLPRRSCTFSESTAARTSSSDIGMALKVWGG